MADGYIADILGPLGEPALLGRDAPAGWLADSCVLQQPLLVAFDDIRELIVQSSTIFVMDLVTPTGVVRVPISSWQATLQMDAACYVQCVIPAADTYATAIAVATDFVISQVLTLSNGTTIDYEMARAPAQTLILDRGAFNYTATLSGYTDALTSSGVPPVLTDRTLTGVRSVSTYADGMRVRCSIDWSLRPGQRAYLDSTEILVDYINFYAPGNDCYMDVGERA